MKIFAVVIAFLLVMFKDYDFYKQLQLIEEWIISNSNVNHILSIIFCPAHQLIAKKSSRKG